MTYPVPPDRTVYTFHRDLLDQTHVLIAGATRSGKSVILNGLIYAALLRPPVDCDGGVQLILCDPKRVELSRYKNLPHVLRFANTLETIADALKYAHGLMMSRYYDMERRGLVTYDGGDIYIIVDEFADLITKTPDRNINHVKAQAETQIEAIGRLGGAARVHLILATQSPDRATIKAHIQQNMTAKIALRCDSPIESRQIIGVPGAENITHYGEAFYRRPGYSKPQHITGIPFIPTDQIEARVNWWLDHSHKSVSSIFGRLFKRA